MLVAVVSEKKQTGGTKFSQPLSPLSLTAMQGPTTAMRPHLTFTRGHPAKRNVRGGPSDLTPCWLIIMVVGDHEKGMVCLLSPQTE